MSIPWLKNRIFVEVDKDDMEEVSNPILEYGTMTTLKTMKITCLVSHLIVAPVYIYSRTFSSTAPIKDAFFRCGRYGLLVGLFAGPLLTAGLISIQNLNTNEMSNICQEIRVNTHKIKSDRMLGGFIIGGIAYSLTPPKKILTPLAAVALAFSFIGSSEMAAAYVRNSPVYKKYSG